MHEAFLWPTRLLLTIRVLYVLVPISFFSQQKVSNVRLQSLYCMAHCFNNNLICLVGSALCGICNNSTAVMNRMRNLLHVCLRLLTFLFRMGRMIMSDYFQEIVCLQILCKTFVHKSVYNSWCHHSHVFIIETHAKDCCLRFYNKCFWAVLMIYQLFYSKHLYTRIT